LKRDAGTGWSGKLRWKTAGHGFSASHEKTVADPGGGIGNRVYVSWLFDDSDTDWVSSIILNLQIELGADVGDVFSVDRIEVVRWYQWEAGRHIAHGPYSQFPGLEGNIYFPDGMDGDPSLGYRESTLKIYAAVDGYDADYKLISGGDDLAFIYGRTPLDYIVQGSAGVAEFPPGLNNIEASQDLNDYLGSGSVRPAGDAHNVQYTQIIMSKQFIPCPQVQVDQ